jgi:hypothetical protein
MSRLEVELITPVEHVGGHVRQRDPPVGELTSVRNKIGVVEMVRDDLFEGVGLRDQQVCPRAAATKQCGFSVGSAIDWVRVRNAALSRLPTCFVEWTYWELIQTALTRENVCEDSWKRSLLDLQGSFLKPVRHLADDNAGFPQSSYRVGAPVNDLADRFEIHRSTVLDHVNRAGATRRYPALGLREVEEAAELYRTGQSLRTIGIHFAVHASTVGQYLVRAGIKLRDCQGREW